MVGASIYITEKYTELTECELVGRIWLMEAEEEGLEVIKAISGKVGVDIAENVKSGRKV